LSHWHLDHVAGNEVFRDCEIIANVRTAEHLARRKDAIEAGTLEGPPAIAPLVMPTQTFEGGLKLRIGSRDVELIQLNIHSDDATVVWLPDSRVLLAGDTMEDTVTFVDEPQHLDRHLADLERLWRLAPHRILPAHGDPDWIATGGYPKTFIRATQQYIRALVRMRTETGLRSKPLREVIAGPLDMEWVTWLDAYEDVHRLNVARVVGEPVIDGAAGG
jgi:glyoxylase-like metal-dependent hydrolase (beta-lactamase superfamily II)